MQTEILFCPAMMEEAKAYCKTCDKILSADKVTGISYSMMELRAGDILPAGECPKCNNLVYLTEESSINPAIIIHLADGGEGDIKKSKIVQVSTTTKAYENVKLIFLDDMNDKETTVLDDPKSIQIVDGTHTDNMLVQVYDGIVWYDDLLPDENDDEKSSWNEKSEAKITLDYVRSVLTALRAGKKGKAEGGEKG